MDVSARTASAARWSPTLFPHLATCVDDIAFVHSMYAESPIHGSAMLMMNSGRILSGNPVPRLVGHLRPGQREREPARLRGHARPDGRADQRGQELVERLHAGRLPGARSSAPSDCRSTTWPFPEAPIRRDPAPAARSPAREERGPSRHARRQLRAGRPDRQLRAGLQDAAIRARGGRLRQETAGDAGALRPRRPETADFGRKCLLARRLVERGVRFIQIYSGGAHNDDNWDAHTDLVANHTKHAGHTDKPIAGLLKDLKRRGLLDETLIVWGGEFGRQPTAEYAKGTGRDHNAYGFTMWLAGGGIKGGTSVGQTDELGSAAVEDRFHVKNLHATILTSWASTPTG